MHHFKVSNPFDPLVPHLYRALDASGRGRIMWASDFTAVKTGHSWFRLLFYIRDNKALSPEDKKWIRDRKIFNCGRPRSASALLPSAAQPVLNLVDGRRLLTGGRARSFASATATGDRSTA